NELLERLLNYEKENPHLVSSPYNLLDSGSNKENSDHGTNLEASSSTDAQGSNPNNVEINVEKSEKDNNHIGGSNGGSNGGSAEEENISYKSSSSPYIGSQKKKILSVNNREEDFKKTDLGKMKNYFKNILSSNANDEASKYYKNDEKVDANKNVSQNNDEEKKTKMVIPKITFSESSLSTKNTLQKNILSPPEDNLYLTEEKKRELRKKRFGVVSTDDVLESRAKRFCIVTQKMEEENKRKRAERFGLNKSDKLKARALRFGIK
ncbi:hypothetical protein PCYB_072020, partial [Plasmodium cynomolgi strain B]